VVALLAALVDGGVLANTAGSYRIAPTGLDKLRGFGIDAEEFSPTATGDPALRRLGRESPPRCAWRVHSEPAVRPGVAPAAAENEPERATTTNVRSRA